MAEIKVDRELGDGCGECLGAYLQDVCELDVGRKFLLDRKIARESFRWVGERVDVCE